MIAAQWQRYQQQFDQLSARERVLLAVVVAVILLSVGQWLVLDPLLQERRHLDRQLMEIDASQRELDGKKQILQAQLSAGVNRAKERQRDRLQQELGELDQQIERTLVALVEPQRMPQLLESVLSADSGLKLLGLENKPVELIATDALAAAPAAPAKTVAATRGAKAAPVESSPQSAQSLYKHAFVIRLEGSYPAAVEYFQRLRELPWQFHWDSLDYEVSRYPRATITLEVHTVSMAEEWIGV